MRMYLVQRGAFRTEINNSKHSELDKNILLDYMGSAEFEWGALPKSYNRILDNVGEYYIHIHPDIKNANDVPLLVFCTNKDWEYIKDTLSEFIKANNPKQVSDYRLKEWISFADRHYQVGPPKSRWDKVNEDDFWWDIDNDFFFFYGAIDRANLIDKIVSKDAIMRATERGKEDKQNAAQIHSSPELS